MEDILTCHNREAIHVGVINNTQYAQYALISSILYIIKYTCAFPAVTNQDEEESYSSKACDVIFNTCPEKRSASCVESRQRKVTSGITVDICIS